MKPAKRAVAMVLYALDQTHFFIVERPPDDVDLPNIWGLPAGSVKENETFEAAVIRAGKEKLGVELKIVKKINEGKIEREGFILHMQEFEMAIMAGSPIVPQPVPGITQYVQWKWGSSNDLVEAAQKGSLCSRLYLGSIGQEWK